MPCDTDAVQEPAAGVNGGDFVCQNLFVLDAAPGLAGLSDSSVTYRGVNYAVPSDPVRAGKTLHVLSMVKQLLAINTSAKSLPQTNTISVISP